MLGCCSRVEAKKKLWSTLLFFILIVSRAASFHELFPRFFSTFSSPEYAKAGAIPESDIVIPPGLLDFSSSMLDHFRTLGLVVEVENGKVALRESYVAARLGEPLTPEQAKILTHMKMPIATFTISLNCHWQDGNFEEF